MIDILLPFCNFDKNKTYQHRCFLTFQPATLLKTKLQNRCSLWILRNFSACNFIKTRQRHICFPGNFRKKNLRALPSRHTTSFQHLHVFTTSPTLYWRLINVETTPCVYWVIFYLQKDFLNDTILLLDSFVRFIQSPYGVTHSRPYHFKFLKSQILKILVGPFCLESVYLYSFFCSSLEKLVNVSFVLIKLKLSLIRQLVASYVFIYLFWKTCT